VWGVIGLFALVLVGIGLLILGIFAVARMTATPPATATSAPLPTQIVVIPTTTPLPPATATATLEPTETRPAASPTRDEAEASATAATTEDAETPAAGTTGTPRRTGTPATATPGDDSVTTTVGANVRSGPGTNYPAVGALEQGASAPAIGRNAAGTWFVIEFSGGFGGEGWISGQVVEYGGDVNDLPVVAAPPPPAASATPRPSSNPAPGPVAGAHGVTGQLTMCGGKLAYAVNERVCFVETIRNTTGEPISYGVLGVIAINTATGATQFQTSWDGSGAPGGWLWIDPGCTGPTDRCNGAWEDGMRLGAAGNWRLSMQVCFSDFGTCLNGGDWETLSAPITVSVN
jgi:hypothetical protein